MNNSSKSTSQKEGNHGFKNSKKKDGRTQIILKRLQANFIQMNHINQLFFGTILFILLPVISFAQSDRIEGLSFIHNIEAGEYGEHPQNWDIVQDKRGMIYIANGNGVLEYDGETFKLIEVPKNGTVRSLVIGENNRIYVGGDEEIGYLEPHINGNMEYVSLLSKLDKKYKNFTDVWDVSYDGESVFFRTYHYLLRYYKDSVYGYKTNTRYEGDFIINDQYYFNIEKKGLHTFKNDSIVLAPYGNQFKDKYYFTYGIEGNNNKALFSNDDQLYWYNPAAKNSNTAITRFKTEADEYLKEGRIYQFHKTPENNYLIGTLANKGAVLVDSSGKTIKKINSTHGLLNGGVYNVNSDKQGNAWLTMSKGVANVEISTPITFWDDRLGLKGSVEDIIKYKGTIYVATAQGLYYLNDYNKFQPIGNFKQQCWDFLIYRQPNDTTKTRLLTTGNNNIFEIKNFKLHTAWTLKNQSPAFSLYQSQDNPELLYAGLADGMVTIKNKNGTFVDEQMISQIKKPVRSIEQDQKENFWLGLFRNGAVKLKLNKEGNKAISEKLYDLDDGFRSTKNVLIYPFRDRLIFASDKGFHKYDYATDRIVPDSSLGSSFGDGSRDVFEFQELKNGIVWCTGLKNRTGEIGYGTLQKDGSYKWTYAPFRRIPEMMIFGMYVEENGRAWIGGSKGLYCYRPELKRSREPFLTLIRKVKLGKDSVIFKGNSYQKINNERYVTHDSVVEYSTHIDYDFNNLTFQFAALSFEDINNNQYAYYLEGYEDKWSDWTENSFKQYTSLPNGDYTFHVKSKNVYGDEGKVASFKFTINPPWYRSIFAYIAYVVFLALLILIIIRIYTRNLKRKNLLLEKKVKERTNEIEQQKEEIEQQKDSITNQANQLRLTNQELRKLTIVARETDNGVIITDAEGNIEWINEGFVRLFGYNIVEVRERFGSNFIKASSVDSIDEIFNKVKTNKTSETYESRVVSKNGEIINTYTTLSPVLDNNGEVEKIIAIDSDIRELKKAEEKLKTLNATKDKFFSIIAHDLKNPFSSLLGATDLLIKKFDQLEEEKILEFIRNLNQVAKQGYDLLINLLEWSRAQTGRLKFEMQTLNLYDLVISNIDLLIAQAQNKNIQIINDIDPEINIHADKNTVLTVLRNLLSNAIKYTHKGGKIRISANIKNKYVKVTVADDGIGIPKEKQDKLFRIDENYSQKGTNDESGTGLGLILCKEFVEKNKGEINVESKEGEGSKFIFTLLRQ